MAGVTNFAMSAVVSDGLCSVQRGFVKGRNFLQNLVELDAESRILSNQFQAGLGDSTSFASWSESFASAMIPRMPALALLDIAAAFPSLSHRFLFAVLRAIGVPNELLNYITALYTGNTAVDTAGRIMFLVLSGGSTRLWP